MDNPDIVVVGGGIAGGAMATVLARAGHSVLMLEITKEHRDVVRGEWMAPWGVAEAQRLGLHELYVQAGGHHLSRMTSYAEDVATDEAEARSIDFTTMIPGVPGPLCLGHPKACALLDEAALAAGARFLRGVRHTRVAPGERPSVSFEYEGKSYDIRPRLVIAADGRHGPTRKQVGIELHQDPVHNLLGGMLVDGMDDWPSEKGATATEGRYHVLIFPQGQGRARLYVAMGEAEKDVCVGPDAPRRFLDAFRLDCLPGGEIAANARAISTPFAYPNNDTWTDEPHTEGVVLIGDAAGHNDPIIGQGLSIAHRDVRIVRDILLGGPDWSPGAFAPYAEERRERMRRLRIVATTFARREVEFGPEARARRKRARQNMAERPELMQVLLPVFVGPEAVPPETFNKEMTAAVCGD